MASKRTTKPRRRNPVSDCPLTAALAAMSGKWKLIIIYWLAEAPRHFAARRKLMPQVSQKVLTEQLRELIADAIVHREQKGPVPAPVVYSLTSYGRSLMPTCLGISAYRSNKDGARFFIHSRWRDEPAFETHALLPHTVEFLETLAPLLTHEVEVARLSRIA